MKHMEISAWHEKLSAHPFYAHLYDHQALKIFMSYHVFAVWDFMSLLKSLQKELTCVELPWRPSPYPKKLTRLINEIVLGEESDLDLEGQPMDHFSLYLKAMEEVGADLTPIQQFLQEMDMDLLPKGVREFVEYNLNLAINGQVHEVAAAFFYGREKLIPSMFEGIVENLRSSHSQVKHLVYYLERHIELDGGEHSHLAKDCLEILCSGDALKIEQAHNAGLKSLELRYQLWDAAFDQYRHS